MKKISVLFVAALLCLAFAACDTADSGKTSSAESAPSSTVSVASAQDSSADVPESSASEPQSDAEPAAADVSTEGDLGDYHVKILDAVKATDYEGNPALIVSYEFTNNSKDNQMFMVAVNSKAFQDGIQLDTAMIMDNDNYDSGASMKQIQPGATLTVQAAYLLTSETPVQVEASELISLDDAKITKTFDPATLS